MPSSLPTELQIEVVHHLRHDPSSLYRLCLVSQQLRFLAQLALFYRLDTVCIHPGHRGLLGFHQKLSYCGQKEHRHVLKLVREFIVNTAGPNDPFIVPFWLKWCIPSHPIALLPYMSNLNHLTININFDVTGSLHQLISSPFNLEGLFFSYKWCYFEDEDEFALMTFISRQTRLKYLGLSLCDRRDGALSDLPAGTLTRLEFIDDQFRLATRSRASVTGIHITETWVLDDHIPENIMEMEWRLAHACSAIADLHCLEALKERNFLLNKLEFLWVEINISKGRHKISQRIFMFTNLKVLILEPIHKGNGSHDDRLACVQTLFTRMPTLEQVGFYDLILKVWTRGDTPCGKVINEVLDDRLDFSFKCHYFRAFQEAANYN